MNILITQGYLRFSVLHCFECLHCWSMCLALDQMEVTVSIWGQLAIKFPHQTLLVGTFKTPEPMQYYVLYWFKWNSRMYFKTMSKKIYDEGYIVWTKCIPKTIYNGLRLLLNSISVWTIAIEMLHHLQKHQMKQCFNSYSCHYWLTSDDWCMYVHIVARPLEFIPWQESMCSIPTKYTIWEGNDDWLTKQDITFSM